MIVPDSVCTLQQLLQFKGVLWCDNPCVASRGRCVYLTRDTTAFTSELDRNAVGSLVESRYFLETIPLPSFLTRRAFDTIARRAEFCASDSYICHGSVSRGSGRSVVKDEHQLKGVGRTAHASYHEHFDDLHGALPLREAAREVIVETLLRNVLSTAPIPIDFILIPNRRTPALVGSRSTSAKRDIRCVMGRRGSPLRLGHLEYLSAALRSENEEAVGSYLVHLLLSHGGGVPRTGIAERVLAEFEHMMRRAIRLTAESRVYSIKFAYWPDNFDLYSRVFDVGETSFRFPDVLRDDTVAAAPEPDESPYKYLVRQKLELQNEYQRCLYPVRNVLSAMYLVANAISLSPQRLKQRFSWSWIRDQYESSVAACIARLIGAAESMVPPSTQRAIATAARRYPLLGTLEINGKLAIDWEALSEKVGDPAHATHARELRAMLDGHGHRLRLQKLDRYLERHVIDPYLTTGARAVERLSLGNVIAQI